MPVIHIYVDELNKQNCECQKAQAEKALVEAKAEIEQLKANSGAVDTTALDEANQKLADAEIKVTELENSLSAKSAELDNTQARVSTLEQDNANWQTEYAKLEDNVTKLKQELAGAQANAGGSQTAPLQLDVYKDDISDDIMTANLFIAGTSASVAASQVKAMDGTARSGRNYQVMAGVINAINKSTIDVEFTNGTVLKATVVLK